jgi:hypothetical protein
MWRTLWQRGIISLTLASLCAAALQAVSPEVSSRVRTGLRDCVLPGTIALQEIQSSLERVEAARKIMAQQLAGRLAEEDENTDAKPHEQELLQSELRRLEVVAAALRQRAAAAEGQLALAPDAERSSSLLRVTTQRARVIGSERGAINALAARLVDAGAADGIAVSDLVLEPLSGESEADEIALIDRGRDAEFVVDLPVAAGRTLVGRIKSAGRLTSSVQLVTDPKFRVGARIVRSAPDGPVEGASGVFAGGGTDACRLELVPATAPVTVGDRVYTHEMAAGESLRLYVGEIVRAEAAPGDPHWRIEVRPDLAQIPAVVEVVKVELNPARLASEAAALNAGDERR